jgi:hypothetical protein
MSFCWCFGEINLALIIAYFVSGGEITGPQAVIVCQVSTRKKSVA